jgi:hypothetical protein
VRLEVAIGPRERAFEIMDRQKRRAWALTLAPVPERIDREL